MVAMGRGAERSRGAAATAVISVVLSVACALTGCRGAAAPRTAASSPRQGLPSMATTLPRSEPTMAGPGTPPMPGPRTVVIAYRIERATSDAATADFEAVVQSTLSDRHG